MKTNSVLRLLVLTVFLVFLSRQAYSQATNNTCATAVTLTPATTCTTTAPASSTTGNLQKATSASADGAVGGSCGGATAATTFDVWYKFTATTTTTAVTISGLGSAYTPYVEVLSGSCGTLTPLTCSIVSTTPTRVMFATTVATTYYVRVYTLVQGTSNPKAGWDFDICVQTPPTNDNCTGALSLTPSSSCSNTAGTLDIATATGGLPAGCEAAGTHYDVWYSFVATSTTHLVTISSLVNISSPEIQLYSGSCGALVSLQCGSSTLTAQGLTIGNTYYVRVSNIGSSPISSTFNICVVTPPANDECAGAISLTPNTSCSTTAGTMVYATASPGVPLGCYGAGTYYDVWYSFTATQTIATVTLGGLAANFTAPQMQVYSGTCGALTSLQCGASSIALSGLTIGSTYYVRVSNLNTAISANGAFTICVTSPPSNDDCAGAIALYTNTTCSNTSASLASATPSAGIPLGCAAAGTYYDVWFSFVAANSSETVTASSITGVTTSAIQLYSGTCGALTSIACGTTSIAATGLSAGVTYYVRVSSVNAAATGSGSFNICVTHPAPSATTLDYGKSYVNISKNSGGGTINPGDTLEVRATLVIKSGSAGLDSLAFLDTLHLGAGARLVPGSIALRTNEGKVYKSFTDAATDDEGYFYTSGTDTVIRINFGANASATKRGKLLNTSKPSVFGSTCIIMATYRVVVYAPYGSMLSLGGGKITGSTNAASGVVSDFTFSPRSAMVYSSPGLCPNAVSASNAIGGDNNGTFGSGTPQNRAPSGNVLGYTYATFTTANPQDYYYGIANNTSAGGSSFTTTTTWAKPDNSSPTHRVFNLWDITGDHTGAANPTKGNAPCDPTKPVSATNPCGYMLVVNSAYRTDTAFQYSVTNLCPNTYYEISAWFKNICYKCGCDSNGNSSTTAGYIPSAPNDSSGVQPNITFDINGSDYYTTGNIVYGGLLPSTQAGSDTNNTWVKRGFTYRTGSSQTSLLLTIRNNAPGGGGNDWAMDDIALSTCLPSMKYSPTINPFVCLYNPIVIRDTISSYFNNYTNFKWQRSVNGGTSWTDITGVTSLPDTNYYITSYSIPPTNTSAADNGDLYRVVVATTTSNLANTNCNISDGVTITLTVQTCGPALDVNIMSFNGQIANSKAMLSWATSKEIMPVSFVIERSSDGINFVTAGETAGYNNGDNTNRYGFTDPAPLNETRWYRIVMIKKSGDKKYSAAIQLKGSLPNFELDNIINPFSNNINFTVSVAKTSDLTIELSDMSGRTVIAAKKRAFTGTNSMLLDTPKLPAGVYSLRVVYKDQSIIQRVIKR